MVGWYNCLVMGLKPSHGELNADLRPVFSHTKDAHLIHDDLTVTTNSHKDHVKVIDEIMWAIYIAGLTWNPIQCQFGRKTISFWVWGMIYEADGFRPDPSNAELVTRPQNRIVLVSFLCMMQSNEDFISNISQRLSALKEMTKNSLNVLRYTNKVLIN